MDYKSPVVPGIMAAPSARLRLFARDLRRHFAATFPVPSRSGAVPAEGCVRTCERKEIRVPRLGNIQLCSAVLSISERDPSTGSKGRSLRLVTEVESSRALALTQNYSSLSLSFPARTSYANSPVSWRSFLTAASPAHCQRRSRRRGEPPLRHFRLALTAHTRLHRFRGFLQLGA